MDNKNTMKNRKNVGESKAMQMSLFLRIQRDLQIFTLTVKVAYFFFTIEFKQAVFIVYQGKKKDRIYYCYYYLQPYPDNL